MPAKTPPTRKYDSSRRQAQARQTRLQIVEAARVLFLERGYAGTSIEAIAEKACVAPETIYATFKNKRNVLSFLFDISIGGDDEDIRLLDRPDPQAVLKETDQHRLLTLFARDITKILQRAAPVFEILRIAAKTEPEIAELVQSLVRERLANMNMVAKKVAENGPLREGLTRVHAAELIWSMTSPELYLLLTRDLHWTDEQYTHWLTDTLIRLLLP
ncbi:MAG: TetR/AcrR family transcriptional regulator [Bacteroidota bacterium]